MDVPTGGGPPIVPPDGPTTRALGILLEEVKHEGLRYVVEITTDPENVASRRVIEANGRVPVE